MPRIRKTDKLFERCEAIAKRRFCTISKEYAGLKAGDLVRCTYEDFNKYSGRVIAFIKTGGDHFLCLVHVPCLPKTNYIVWGTEVLSLEAKHFKLVEES